MVWMLTWESIVVGSVIGVFATAEWPTVRQWALASLLVICAGVHMHATRPGEERRRAGRLRTEYVDHSGLWTFGAALALPIPMAVVFIVGIGVHRWQIARKPPCRVIFTNATIQASAVATAWWATAVPGLAWLRGDTPIPTTSMSQVAISLVSLSGVMVIYFATQTLIIGVARLCQPPGSSARSLHPSIVVRCIGTWPDNRELLLTLLAGFGCAVAANVLAGVPLVLVTIGAVAVTRKVQLAELRDRQRRLDAKTGLLNAVGWARAARTALYRHYLDHRLCAVLLVDIDHFKLINDEHGHHNGDIAIRAVGRTLQDQTRPGDLVARFGGEEFVVLLTSTVADEALATAERIRQAVAALDVRGQRSLGGTPVTMKVKVSIGLALQRAASDEDLAVVLDHILALSQLDDQSAEEMPDLLTDLESSADAALYRAKDQGRDRVVVAPHPDTAPANTPMDTSSSSWNLAFVEHHHPRDSR
ncbi:diguanylate cyclase (GGDEF)-like protein [Kibdelosporangium phytohabitans]|nr:diguanylate cyclase (GGDEF)-like protein [Kibdelosporangium phytohabitans]